MWLDLFVAILFFLILSYIVLGVYKIGDDIRRGPGNRPSYLRNPILILFVWITWLPLTIKEIIDAGGTKKWLKLKKSTEVLEKLIKERNTLKQKLQEHLKKGNFKKAKAITNKLKEIDEVFK